MSQILDVLKNRNRVERKDKQRRQDELNNIRSEAVFRARLYEDMRLIDISLRDESVKKVIINIPKVYVSRFMRAMYGEEMAQYSIVQMDEQRFEISRKMINF